MTLYTLNDPSPLLRGSMDHLSIEDAIDVARRISNSEQDATVARHLTMGCADCSKTLDFWRHFMKLSTSEFDLSPPDVSIRQAIDYFTMVAAKPFPQADIEM